MSTNTEPRTMSVTAALQELKMMRKRVDEKRVSVTFVTTSESRDQATSAVSTLQSIRDLMARIRRLDGRIKQSNAVTKVCVGDDTYTVAEALALKEQMILYTSLRDELRSQYRKATDEINFYNQQAQSRLDNLLRSHFGKDSKTSPADHDALTAHFQKNNSIKLVDPINAERVIQEMTDFIDTFTQNVDVALAESNALTRILAD